MANNYPTPQAASPISRQGAVVTPDDANDLPMRAARGLYVGGAGDLTVDLLETGENLLFAGFPGGFFGVAVRRVYATGTTATDIIALG